MSEAITESIERITELIDLYGKASAEATTALSERLVQLDSVCLSEGKNPALEKYVEEKSALIRESVRTKTVTEILGTANMPKKSLAEEVMRTEEYAQLFEKRLAESSDKVWLDSVKCASQLRGTERLKYEKIYISSFSAGIEQEKAHLKNLIKKI